MLERVGQAIGVGFRLHLTVNIPRFEVDFLAGGPDFVYLNPYHQLMARRAQGYVPLVRERAIKIAPATIGPLLEEKFSEDELRQLVLVLEMLESPVSRKFEQLGPSIEKALAEKLDADMRSVIEPKVRALDQAVVAHLGGSSSAVGPIAPAGPVNPAPALGSNSVLRLPKAMGK